LQESVWLGLSSAALHRNTRTRPLVAAERDRRILALRNLGVQVETIAAELGISGKTVQRVIARRIRELNRQISIDVAAIRAGHLMELQGLRDRLRPVLASPDHSARIGAARTWLGVLQREAALLGLDAPARIELHAEAQAAEALLQRLADALPSEAMDQIVAVLTADAPPAEHV